MRMTHEEKAEAELLGKLTGKPVAQLVREGLKEKLASVRKGTPPGSAQESEQAVTHRGDPSPEQALSHFQHGTAPPNEQPPAMVPKRLLRHRRRLRRDRRLGVR